MVDLKAYFQSLQDEASPLTPDTLAEALEPTLLPCIDRTLVSSLCHYIGSINETQKETLSWASYSMAVDRLLSTDAQISLEAMYAVFKGTGASLETFVLATVTSGIPIWFQGTTVLKASDSAWTSTDKTHRPAAVQLTLYLLHWSHNAECLHQQRQEEMMDFQDTPRDTSSTTKDEEDPWKKKTKDASLAVLTDFTHWAHHTPAWKILFQLVIESIFLPSSPPHHHPQDTGLSHQRRLEHRLAPVLGQPDVRLVGAKAFSRILTPFDYYLLTHHLPPNALSWSEAECTQRKEQLSHQLIFSSKREGASWQVFVHRIVSQGATLLVLKTKEGAVLGGYADEAWQLGTDWTGEADNFLFRLRSVASDPITDQGAMGVWDGHQGVNRHFQYLCWGKKSLPNGLGMGGQFEYAGVWFNSDFSTGHSRGDPVCTTYMSPPLAPKETFSIDEVEVWLVRPLPHDEDEEEQAKGSALDRSEDMAFLEMAGKKLYSRDLSKPEEESEEEDLVNS